MRPRQDGCGIAGLPSRDPATSQLCIESVGEFIADKVNRHELFHQPIIKKTNQTANKRQADTMAYCLRRRSYEASPTPIVRPSSPPPANLIPVPTCTMIPDFYSTPGLFYRPHQSFRPAGMRLQAAARQCPTREALVSRHTASTAASRLQRGKRWAHPTTALSGTKFSPLSPITSPRNNLGSGSRPAQCFGNLIQPQPYATGQTNRSGQPACCFKPQHVECPAREALRHIQHERITGTLN